MVLGAIPGGTGNGLIKSLLDRSGENYGVNEAAFRIIKGNIVNVDLTEYTLEYEPAKKVYSFLSLAWSIVADIDINSEAIRCCGPTRFTVWGVWRCIFMRNYWGSLRYLGEESTRTRVLSVRSAKNSTDLANTDSFSDNKDSYPLSANKTDDLEWKAAAKEKLVNTEEVVSAETEGAVEN